ncbi:pentalenene oxygenase [Amycolatopsis pretoriensis]|uniref:Pentalenene oxygenase n=2 Tax=Amycolatopsis pretoriensis TaxID=218821 RepID=A0A1H5QNL7_9PSEU|nr:pentalenene oxygenase [Amycolatopsis pretoriensis]
MDLVAPAVGRGLATCPRSEHRAPRRLLQPLFHPKRLEGYVDGMVSAVRTVLDDWRDGDVLDVPLEMRKLSLRIAVSAFFSNQLPPAVRDQTADDMTAILVGFAQRLARPPLFDLLPTPANRRYKAALRRLRRMAADTVATRRANAQDPGDDFLALLIDGKDARGVPVHSERGEIDQLLTFLVAPTATAGSVLSWALQELATKPGLQERLREEAQTVLVGSPAAAEHLGKLEFTKQVVTETLRMYPSLWFAPLRIVTADTQLGGYDLPAGTVVAFSPYLVQRSAEFYVDPDRFDPDRWDSASLPAPSRQAFIPFGTGARQCIAQDFAFNELVLALATLAAQWRFEPVAGRPLPTRASVNLTPRALYLRVFSRENTEGGTATGVPSSQSAGARPGNRRPTSSPAWQI